MQDKYRKLHPRLLVTVAETLLHTDPQIELPLWLVHLFKVISFVLVWIDNVKIKKGAAVDCWKLTTGSWHRDLVFDYVFFPRLTSYRDVSLFESVFHSQVVVVLVDLLVSLLLSSWRRVVFVLLCYLQFSYLVLRTFHGVCIGCNNRAGEGPSPVAWLA